VPLLILRGFAAQILLCPIRRRDLNYITIIQRYDVPSVSRVIRARDSLCFGFDSPHFLIYIPVRSRRARMSQQIKNAIGKNRRRTRNRITHKDAILRDDNNPSIDGNIYIACARVSGGFYVIAMIYFRAI